MILEQTVICLLACLCGWEADDDKKIKTNKLSSHHSTSYYSSSWGQTAEKQHLFQATTLAILFCFALFKSNTNFNVKLTNSSLKKNKNAAVKIL